MKNIFKKILVELTKPHNPKEKHQLLLHAIGGGWHMKKVDGPGTKQISICTQGQLTKINRTISEQPNRHLLF